MDIPETPIPYPYELMEAIELAADDTLRVHRSFLQTIFPRVEALLSLSVYQDALGFVGREAMKKYRDLTDFLLCELFPEYEKARQTYYAGGGSQLKDSWSGDEMLSCERAMLCLLAIALVLRQDNLGPDAVCPVRWTTIVRHARELAVQAPPEVAPQ